MFKRFYDVFRSISTLVHSITSVDEVLELVVWKTTDVLDGKGAILRILNLETGEADLFASYGLGEKYLSKDPVSSRKMITDLCRQNKVVIIENIATDSRVKNKKELKEDGIQMILDVPLILRTDMLGIIRIYFSEPREFLDEELSFVGAVAETCACAIDKATMIEEQKSQYDQLALHTEKLSALGRMAAGIAHEINNPLAGILLFSSRIRKKVTEEGPIKEGLDVIIQETQRCKGIIQDLLEFSRDKEPEKAEANINDIIEKALGILENEFRIHHISVERDLSGEMPSILLDVNLIQQVFVNLLINAVEAIQENGVITIQSYVNSNGESVGVGVADTGSGIQPDDMAKIFEPFFSSKKNGTGLGLAVSYGIVQKHRGNIQVSSQLGEGSRFTVEIPIK
jgi:two-component system NtrC family sensor kinase